MKDSFLYRLIIAGATVSAATLSISLFVYFEPDIAKDTAEKGNQLFCQLAQLLPWAEQTGAQSSESEDSISSGQDDMDANSNGNESDASQTDSNTVRELGNISELDMEYSPIPTDAIYSSMLDTSMGPMLYYCQGDRRWADYLYGGADPMKKYGCGPTAVAMLVNSFSPNAGYGVTPVDIAEWAASNGGYAPQGGSYHSLIPNALSAYGLQVEGIQDRSPENVARLLSEGWVFVALMGKGALTNNGHFVIFTGLTDTGNITIADPNRYENCLKEWDLSQLLSELKENYDSGGPLWGVRAKIDLSRNAFSD